MVLMVIVVPIIVVMMVMFLSRGAGLPRADGRDFARSQSVQASTLIALRADTGHDRRRVGEFAHGMLGARRRRNRPAPAARSILLSSTRSAARNMTGYFAGLSSPSVDRQQHDIAVLAEVEARRAHQIADVLDEDDVEAGKRQVVQGVVHHAGVEMAGAAGGDLDRRHAVGADAAGIVVGFEVAFDHRDAEFRLRARRWWLPAARSCRRPAMTSD